jgi:hypothetical protein
MATQATPEAGDVVVRQERRDGQSVFILRTAHGADQFLVRSHAEAVAQATAFAKRERVRLWFTNGDSELTLIENFRAAG